MGTGQEVMSELPPYKPRYWHHAYAGRCKCGSDHFHVIVHPLRRDRCWTEIQCAKCAQTWTASRRGSRYDVGGLETLAEIKHEPCDVVPSNGQEEADRPVTLADLRHLKRMQLWLACNPDWEGE